MDYNKLVKNGKKVNKNTTDALLKNVYIAYVNRSVRELWWSILDIVKFIEKNYSILSDLEDGK